jgi:CheY-like chemotaxis protein
MKKTLLIVDDEPAIVAALTRVLRNRGFNMLTANSGQEALEIMQHSEVCVVLSDYQMPQMNGLQLLKQIAIQWPQTKRLMLTGNNDNSEILKCKAGKTSTVKSGSNENLYFTDELKTRKTSEQETDVIHQVLSKPWTTEQLTLAIEHSFNSETILNLKASAKANLQPTIQIDSLNASLSQIPRQDTIELINHEAIEQLVADVSEEVFPELTDLFIESTEQRLELLEQADKQQYTCAISAEVRLQLHTLASSMALYGLVHSAQSARYLEHAADSEVQHQLEVFCEKARQSLVVFKQQLIKRTQIES